GDVFTKKEQLEHSIAEPTYFSATTLSNDTSAIDRLMEQLKNDVYKEPQNATVLFTPQAEEPFYYEEGRNGQYIDSDPIQEAILESVERMESREIQLEQYIEYQAPEITVAQLQENRQLRGSYETKIRIRTKTHDLRTNSENRLHNISLSIDALNDYNVIIDPGKSFSFNDIVGRRTVEKGYKEAIEYVNGKEEIGIGGGVCQTSTTIYLAAVRAGMKITERRSHSLETGYAEKGKDATVYMDGRPIDLKFKNTTDAPIYLVGKVYNHSGENYCKFDVYGADPKGISYDIQTNELIIIPPEDQVLPDKKGEYVMYTDEEYYLKQEARDGVEVERFLIKYVNGEEVSREQLETDIYKPKGNIYYTGIHERPME
ncbi:MAG: hypothetical protein GX786_10750, partial [Clostridiales bacterium]|nr:hypothetical protein [Clostridiales bacterium]